MVWSKKDDVRQATANRSIAIVDLSFAIIVYHIGQTPIVVDENKRQKEECRKHNGRLNRITERDGPLPTHCFAEENDEADTPGQCFRIQLACVFVSNVVKTTHTEVEGEQDGM